MPSCFILFIFQRLVTNHLNRIASYAQQLAPDHLQQPLILKRRAKANAGGDELDHVVNAINDMRVTLQESYGALRESERRFRAIFDQTFQFIGLMEPDGIS